MNDYITNMTVKYENNFFIGKSKTKGIKAIKSPKFDFKEPDLKDLQNYYYYKVWYDKRKKTTEFLRFERLMLCINNRMKKNKKIVNYFNNDNDVYKSITNYKCGLKNCLFCKRSRLLKNTLNHNIKKIAISDIDVNKQKLFITVSVDVDKSKLTDVEFKEKTFEFRENIKSYFDSKNINFFAMLEIGDRGQKLHSHIIVFDIQQYSFSAISSDLRGLFGYTFIEKVKTQNEIDNNVFDYISKVFEYISKAYKGDKELSQQNFIEISKQTYGFFKYFSSDKNYIMDVINNIENKVNEKTLIDYENSLKKVFDTVRKSNINNAKDAMIFLFSEYYYRYSYLIKKIIQRENDNVRVKIKQYKIELSNYNESKNLFSSSQKPKFDNNIFLELSIKIEKIIYSVFKNFFLSKIKYYFELSETFNNIVKDVIEIENNKVNVFSSFFLTAVFKKTFFTNISVLKNKTTAKIKTEKKEIKINELKYKKTKVVTKENDNESKTTIEIIKNNELYEKRNKKNTLDKTALLFYEKSIKQKNLTMRLKDFKQENIKELIFLYCKNKAKRALNKYKANNSESDYNDRLTQLIKDYFKQTYLEIKSLYS